jgi:hypothetical protein
MSKQPRDKMEKCCSDPEVKFRVKIMWKACQGLAAVVGLALLTRLMSLLMGNG